MPEAVSAQHFTAPVHGEQSSAEMENVMRHGKKLMAVLMSMTMFAGLVAGAGGIEARAEEQRVYEEKYDKVFEDFNREDISDTVKLSSDAKDSGKSYLEVKYGPETPNPDDAIYKQAVPGEAGRGNLVIIMRSPDGSASLDDIILGTRYNDSFPVYGKTLSELSDANLDELPELTDEYQKYVINFANSYEDTEVYEGSDVQVNSGIMVGFHRIPRKEQKAHWKSAEFISQRMTVTTPKPQEPC